MTRSYTYNIITRVTLAITMMGSTVCAWAEDPEPTYVAQIGEQKYETLQAAVAAANQATEATTITLLLNVAIDNVEDKLTIAKPVILDMDGKTITSTIEEPFLVDGRESNTGALTITGNGTIAGPTGTYAAAHDGKAMITVQGHNAHLYFVNGTMTCGGSGSDGMYGVYILESGSAVFGEQEGKTGPNITAWFAAIGENNTTAPANITIYGGTYKQDATPSDSDWWEYFCAPVYASASGAITIEGGTFNGRYAFASRYGNVAQTLNISGGDFNGTKKALLIGSVNGDGQSGTRTIGISGGTYSSSIPSEYCSADFSPLINEDGSCTVASTSEQEEVAEALSNGSYYKVLGNAITAAGTNATEINVLKNPVADAITIPTAANITLTVANEVTLEKPITNNGTLSTSGTVSGTITNSGTLTMSGTISGTITNSGTLTISSGTITGAITIADVDATVKIASEVNSTSVVALDDALKTNNVLKSNTTKNSGYTTYWVEKKVDAKVSLSGEPTSEQITAANTLVSNTAISTVELAVNHSLTITVTSVTLTGSKVTNAEFDVKLIGADGQEVIGAVDPAVTFHLPIPSGTEENAWTNLWHSTTALTGAIVLGSDNKYVAITATTFGTFSYDIIATPIAEIGVTKFGTMADAITAAGAESEIKLLADVTENISVSDAKNITLTIGTHTISGNINNAGTLVISENTGTLSGTVANTGTLTVKGGTVSGAVTATNGSLTISGGTISNTITTSDAAGLKISGGTITDALTIGGSGDNTISDGTITGAVTTSAATAISGGEISGNITNTGALTITGGTLTGTIANSEPGTVAISGGTHTQLPVAAFCATGYMPLKNDAEKYTMTNEWAITDATDINASNFSHLTKANGYSVATATYYRNTGMVSAGNTDTRYGTICLPFDIKAQPTDMTLYKAASIDSEAGTLTITPVTYTDPIAAGTPLIFELTAAASHMTVTSTAGGGISINIDTPSDPTDDNLLRGTYSSTNITTGLTHIYYLNGDTFHQAVNSLTVPAFRAYMYYASAGAKQMAFSIVKEDDATDSISTIDVMESVTGVYDLNGRKLNGLQRGMNIMRRADGTTFKVIVK